MKLESLKSSKFEAFKGTELQNLVHVIGGMRQNMSTLKHSSCSDSAEKTCPNNGDTVWDDIRWKCVMTGREGSELGDEYAEYIREVQPVA
jgi:hypothetical protein